MASMLSRTFLATRSPILAAAALGLLGACSSGGSGESAPPQFSTQELGDFASALLITSPAAGSLVTAPSVTATATVPPAAGATGVDLYVDGELVSSDSNGAPWEFELPSYFWSDSNVHSLSLQARLSSGQSITSTQQHGVIVSAAIGDSLSFADGVADANIQDSNTLDVSLIEVETATAYEVEAVGPNGTVLYESTGPAVTLTDLPVGTQNLRFRAGRSFGGGGARFGAWSEAVNVAVLAPALPGSISSDITQTEGAFSAQFSWDLVLPEDEYDVILRRQGADTTEDFTVSGAGELTVDGLPAGEHEWQLVRRNEFGHESLPSDVAVIEAGVFSTQFGGTNQEFARQLLATSDGGAVALASSSSTEITGLPSSTSTSWIFKVDEQGTLLWQHVDTQSPTAFYTNLIELSDGSLLAYGRRGDEEASALRISSDGAVIWQQNYVAQLDQATRNRFTAGVAQGDELTLISVEENASNCSFFNCENPVLVKLNIIDIQTGALAESTELPTPAAGTDITAVSDMGISQSGNRYLAGTLAPVSGDGFASQVFIAEIDDQAATLNTLQIGAGIEMDVQGITQLTSGDYVVTIREMFEFFSIRRIDSSLSTELAGNVPTAFGFNSDIGAVQETASGRILSLFPLNQSFMNSGSDFTVTLLEFDDSLNTMQSFVPPDDLASEISQSRLILSDDNSGLLLYQVNTGSAAANQLVLRRFVFTPSN